MKRVRTKRFLGWMGCALLVAAAVVPNAFAHPNPRITVLFGGSFLSGERAFVVNGNPFISQFLNGGKFRLRGSLDLTSHWTLEGDYSIGRNDQRITEESGGILVHRDFGITVGQGVGNNRDDSFPRNNCSLRNFSRLYPTLHRRVGIRCVSI